MVVVEVSVAVQGPNPPPAFLRICGLLLIFVFLVFGAFVVSVFFGGELCLNRFRFRFRTGFSCVGGARPAVRLGP